MLNAVMSLSRLRLRGPTEPTGLGGGLPVEKGGLTLTPNLRALRLAMSVSDLLLSMGVPANNVVARALDITDAYCDQPVYININFDLITLSQVRGIEYEPLTLVRPVTARETNNMTVQSVQELIYNIRAAQLTLQQAEEGLDGILSHPVTHPRWLPVLANAAIAPAVVLMFSVNWLAIVISFLIALGTDRILKLMAKRLLTPFFRHVAGGIFVSLSAAVIAWIDRRGVHFFDGARPTLIVVGGIVMMVAGLTIIGAVQDAIEEYYLTATARLLRVIMLTSGIIIGILIGLYAARKLGLGIALSPNPLDATGLQFQIIGGACVAAAYALATQTHLRAVPWAGLIGGASVAIMYTTRHLDINIVPATGVAALFAGLVAALFSRLWRTPASGIIAAGIVPLVPGLSLYTGLMQLVNYPPGNPLFFRGVGTLFTVVGVALAIGAGASIGYTLGHPLHRKVTAARNTLPFAEFMHRQIRVGSRANQFAGAGRLGRTVQQARLLLLRRRQEFVDQLRHGDEPSTSPDAAPESRAVPEP